MNRKIEVIENKEVGRKKMSLSDWVKTIWYIIHWNIIYKVLLLLRWVTNKKQILPNIKCLLIVVFCCFHIAFSFFSDAWLLFSLFCFHAFVTSCNYWLLTKRKNIIASRLVILMSDITVFCFCRHCHSVIHINSLFILCIYRQREWTDWIMTIQSFFFSPANRKSFFGCILHILPFVIRLLSKATLLF